VYLSRPFRSGLNKSAKTKCEREDHYQMLLNCQIGLEKWVQTVNKYHKKVKIQKAIPTIINTTFDSEFKIGGGEL